MCHEWRYKHGYLYLGDVGESNEIRDETDYCNEDLLPGSQEMRILIHQGCNEPFHSAELQEKVCTKDICVSNLACQHRRLHLTLMVRAFLI